jgi:hypothetical protein
MVRPAGVLDVHLCSVDLQKSHGLQTERTPRNLQPMPNANPNGVVLFY